MAYLIALPPVADESLPVLKHNGITYYVVQPEQLIQKPPTYVKRDREVPEKGE